MPPSSKTVVLESHNFSRTKSLPSQLYGRLCVPVVVTCGAQLRTAKGEKSPPAAHYAKKQANIPPLGRVSRLAANSNWVPLGGRHEVACTSPRHDLAGYRVGNPTPMGRFWVYRVAQPGRPGCTGLCVWTPCPRCVRALGAPPRPSVTARGRSGVRTKVEHTWAQRMPVLIPESLGFQPLYTQSVCTDPVGLAP